MNISLYLYIQVNFETSLAGDLSYEDACELMQRNQHLSLAITECEMPFLIRKVTHGWTEMCGYSQEAAVGRSFRLIQGAQTDSVQAEYLCQQAAQGLTAEAYIQNYHQSGRVFCNHIRIIPLRSASSEKATHFLGYFEEVDG